MKLRQIIQRLFNTLGYELKQLPKKLPSAEFSQDSSGQKVVGGKVYVGCGDDWKEGYIGCDIRQTKSTSINCKAWELSRYCRDLDEIYSRHMLEHLTLKEAEYCLRDWASSLRRGGRVVIVVPNMDFHVQQWLNAKWDERSLGTKTSNAVWSMAGFWGWQNECDPLYEDYNQTYWDVHKSGYNQASISYFLKRAGFERITCEISDQCHLVAVAIK